MSLTLILTLLASLGLCFAGTTILSKKLSQLSGSKLHYWIRRITYNKVYAAFWGIVIYAIINTPRAISSVLVSMVSSGMVTFSNAMVMIIWGNVGAVVLLYLITIKITNAVLLLLGISGIWYTFSRKNQSMQYFAGALFGLSLLLYGIYAMKSQYTPEEFQYVRSFFDNLQNDKDYIVVLIGFAAQMIFQTATIVIIILMQLLNQGDISLSQVLLIMLGTRIASTFMTLINNLHLSGVGLKVIWVQVLFNCVAVLSNLMLYIIEKLSGIPLIVGLVAGSTDNPSLQIVNFANYYNISGAILMTVFGNIFVHYLNLFIGDEKEDPSRPKFLPNATNSDPFTALDLVYKEQIRISQDLNLYLQYIRLIIEKKEPNANVSRHKQAFYNLNKEIDAFLKKLQSNIYSPLLFDRYFNLLNLNALFGYIGETLYQFRMHAFDADRPAYQEFEPFYKQMLEAFDVIHSTAVEAMSLSSRDDIKLLSVLTMDKTVFIEELASQQIEKLSSYGPEAKQDFFNLLGLFERFIWLYRQLSISIHNEHKHEARE